MPRVNFVKKARKDNPAAGIKVGESYYWWGVMMGSRGVRRFSKTRPTRSMLTQSEFLSTIYDLEDNLDLSGAKSPEDLQNAVQEVIDGLRQLGEETRDKHSNMPDNLQYSATGELLENRADAVEQIADEFENVDLEDFDEDLDESELDELDAEFRLDAETGDGVDEDDNVDRDHPRYQDLLEAKKADRMRDWVSEKVSELEGISWDYE